jgi:hypothetical protein
MPVLPLLFAVFWASVLAWTLLAGRVDESLRRRHPLVHQALGAAALESPLLVGRELALLRFLVAGRYQRLGDPGLQRLCGLLRTLLLAYVAFFLVAPALMLR